jgi:ATP-dependent RNA helicase DDX35
MAFWKPGAALPGAPNSNSSFLTKSKRLGDQGIDRLFSKYSNGSVLILENQILYLIEQNSVSAISGEFQVVKTAIALVESGWAEQGHSVCMVNASDSSCRSSANQIASEMLCLVGEKVGYKLLFEENRSAQTNIDCTTTEMLWREILFDPLLSNYSVIILTESWERSLHFDFLLPMLKK